MTAIVSVQDVRKVYEGGSEALRGVSLEIADGEILGVCSARTARARPRSSRRSAASPCRPRARITVGGHDVVTDFRAARRMIGLVPQEVNLEPFEKVVNTVRFSRGLFGRPRDDGHVERVLRQLTLWDRRDSQVRELSGGMKRRVLIAKALAHEPRVLFLDEPTAGVDVELRKSMWQTVDTLRAAGTTIILTTHYIEEAEAIADRIGVINGGHGSCSSRRRPTLMQPDGAKADDRRAAIAGSTPSPRPSPPTSSRWARKARSAHLRLRPHGEAHRHRLAAARPLGVRASPCATCRPGRSRSRTSSSIS